MTSEIFSKLNKTEQLNYLDSLAPVAKRINSAGAVVLLYKFQGFYLQRIEHQSTIIIVENVSDIENIFNLAFFSRGGSMISPLMGEEDSYEFIRESARYLITHAQKLYPTLPFIYFNLVNSTVNNAGATKFNGHYFIGLNIGTHMLLVDLFNKMFASKSVLPELGNSSIESDDIFELRRIRNNGISFDTHSTAMLVEPKDEDRRLYRLNYLYIARDFLLLHEIAHVAGGHVDYLDLQQKGAQWTEIQYSSTDSNHVENTIFQVLEFEADTFANITYFLAIEDLVKKVDKLPEEKQRIYKDLPTALEHYIFSLYCLFRIINFYTLNPADAAIYQHPPAIVRITKIISDILAFTSIIEIPNRIELLSRISNTIARAEDAFASLTFNQNQLDIYNSNILPSIEYINEILKHVNKAHNLTKPFAIDDFPFLRQYKLDALK